MKLLPRRGTASAVAEVPFEDPDVVDAVPGTPNAPKGRPTPKRRDAGSTRGPAAPPPRTRKEAYRWQKEQTARSKVSAAPGGPKLSREAHREALRRGDASVLPKRDQGPLKALARDYVDTRVMLSNYLLIAFLPIILGPIIGSGNPALARGLQLSTFVILIVVLGEWYMTGTRLRKLARERKIPLSGSALSIGFYAGSRAYLPRRWRLPQPRKARGDQF